jgi:hypothetical protein
MPRLRVQNLLQWPGSKECRKQRNSIRNTFQRMKEDNESECEREGTGIWRWQRPKSLALTETAIRESRN